MRFSFPSSNEPNSVSAPQLAKPTAAAIRRASAILRSGGLVAFPTETVYGLGADARSVSAVRRIFAVKRRPADHPLIVHIADADQLSAWCPSVPLAALRLAEAFWPGPLTVILKRGPGVIDAVTGGQETVGLRVPAHPVALALLREFGDGIAAPSANRFGRVSPTTAAHVLAELGNEVDLILDGGACSVGIESTIVDLSATRPRILRPGQIARDAIEAVLGVTLQDDRSAAPRVSGDMPSHYAPSTPVRWLNPAQLRAALRNGDADIARGVIALGVAEHADAGATVWRTLSDDPAAYARQLYATLRELDALDLDLILLEIPPDTMPWEGVRDRLRRAAGLGAGNSERPPAAPD
jgi:L-threonylcarbamoyladenylate synthase